MIFLSVTSFRFSTSPLFGVHTLSFRARAIHITWDSVGVCTGKTGWEIHCGLVNFAHSVVGRCGNKKIRTQTLNVWYIQLHSVDFTVNVL